MLLELDNIENELTSSYTFTDEDHRLLRSYDGVIEGIAALFGKQCEVILHSLESVDRSVIKIENGFNTGRVEGSPITDLALKMLQDISAQNKQCSKAYFTQTKDGQMMRSMTIAIKNRSERTIGLICININIGASFIDFVQELLPTPEARETELSSENFATTVEELVDRSVEETITDINNRTDIANNAKNKHIVISLHQQGIFDIKDAINMVADKLNISKHTVYLYIRQIKSDEAEL